MFATAPELSKMKENYNHFVSPRKVQDDYKLF